jgi:hypothetical protein
MTAKENPAPRANAENRANKVALAGKASTIKEAAPADFVAVYVATRSGRPTPVTALVARLADIGSAL